MALDGYQISALALGLSPFLVGLIIVLIIGGAWAYKKLQPQMPEIAISAVVILVIVMIVAFIVGNICMRVRPREMFVGTEAEEAPTLESLAAQIGGLEKDACDLITRSDQFIQNNVGKPGQDDPSLVTAAQKKARADLPGPLTDCPVTATLIQGPSAEILSDLENRTTRLETTFLKFTQPILQQAYDNTVPCKEGFFAGGSDSSGDTLDLAPLAARVNALVAAVADQKTKLLKPIDDKTAALQRGEVSDCDKRHGSKTAIAASNKMPAGSVTGV
jgi:hypothetical protein